MPDEHDKLCNKCSFALGLMFGTYQGLCFSFRQFDSCLDSFMVLAPRCRQAPLLYFSEIGRLSDLLDWHDFMFPSVTGDNSDREISHSGSSGPVFSLLASIILILAGPWVGNKKQNEILFTEFQFTLPSFANHKNSNASYGEATYACLLSESTSAFKRFKVQPSGSRSYFFHLDQIRWAFAEHLFRDHWGRDVSSEPTHSKRMLSPVPYGASQEQKNT